MARRRTRVANNNRLLAVLIALFYWLLTIAILVPNSINYAEVRQMPSAVISLNPSVNKVKQGEKFNLIVSIQPDVNEGISAYQTNISYNKDAIRVDKVTLGSLIASPNFGSVGVIDNLNGIVKNIYNVSLNPGIEVINSGDAVILECTALYNGKTSDFALTNTIIAGVEAIALPFDLVINQVILLSLYDLDGSGSVDLSDLQLMASRLDNFNILDMIKLVREITIT